ncbi:MAG TPA: hypothetical protein VED24_04085 [Candidatus Acidoferrum sp.]|nr:hypothetical protein [Candidatus Acidoferrum sp.]
MAQIGSVTVTAATVIRPFAGSFGQGILPGAERLIVPDRAHERRYTIYATFWNGASDLSSMATLDGYVNSQTPIWLDFTDSYGEGQAFGYLASAIPVYEWEDMRMLTYTFLEIPGWGRLAVNSINGYQLSSCDSTGGWNSAVGPEMAPALATPNWTLGTNWSYGTSPNSLILSGTGLYSAQPATALTIVAGQTYRVVTRISSMTAGYCYYYLGGVLANTFYGPGVYVDYVTATTTGNLQYVAPNVASAFTISLVSVELAPALSTVTSGQMEGAGCIQLACSAATNQAVLRFVLPQATDFRQYHGFTFDLQLSSLTNVSSVALRVETDLLDYFAGNDGTSGTLPVSAGKWVQMGFQRGGGSGSDDISTGSPDWSNVTALSIVITFSGSYTGNILIDDLEVVGVGQSVLLCDLNLPNVGMTGYVKNAVQDVLSMLWGNYGWALDRTNKNWSGQLYVVNQGYKHIPTTISTCYPYTSGGSTYGAAGWTMGGTASGMGLGPDTTWQAPGVPTPPLPDLAGCYSFGWSSMANSQYIYADFSPSQLQTNDRDFIMFCFLACQSSTTGFTLTLRLTDGSGNYSEWDLLSGLAPYKWGRAIAALRNPTRTSGTLNTMSVTDVRVYWKNGSGGTVTSGSIKISDVVMDYGDWAVLEEQLPDDPSGSSIYSRWLPSAWQEFLAINHGTFPGGLDANYISTKLATLDGSLLYNMFVTANSAYKFITVTPAMIPGQLNRLNTSSIYGAGTNDYLRFMASNRRGCVQRALLGFKIPPSTGLDAVTGWGAMNKVFLQLNPYYASEATTVIS